ncbi:hypothetical protein ISF_03510 [Cordyceps fumosorosea ARSEF 2679]|uniref:Heat-labile enterotoxin IIA, A chain n=1 Tax=Cordyceps fumosorosea (strain ARSEF 2679) TaxID=1081104 RepID=A0A168ASH6_CORFA|nr:hypothetical protein ISF_03510 [Cordyceps fumosorosea ARSEF 2679]OAA69135.1 hypothetical protein ISF_03510 [Cordyceps fumosorosea ARSEF 2679]
MKISIIHFALLGLSSAHGAIVDRAPPTRAPGQQITDAIVAGISNWGPAGSLKPPSSPKPPLRVMPGSPVPPPKKYDPNVKTGVTRIPGSPLGPAKKCKPCLKKRDICCDSAGKPIKESKPTKGAPAKGGKGGKVTYKAGRFAVPKSAGKAAVFMLVAPYAHHALDSIKRWDNPIGYGVKWFDDAMASLQEAIGGPQRDDIYGNELKYKMTKAIGSALQLGFETDWDRNERLRAEAAAKEKARREEQALEEKRIKGLEELADTCEKTANSQPEDQKLAADILKNCEQLAAAVKRVQAQETAKAKKTAPKKKAEPIYWFMGCKCNRNKLPNYGQKCANQCRAMLSLLGP